MYAVNAAFRTSKIDAFSKALLACFQYSNHREENKRVGKPCQGDFLKPTFVCVQM